MSLQGYLAHEKTHRPWSLQQDYACGRRGIIGGVRFLMGEVPLYRIAYGSVTTPHTPSDVKRPFACRGTSLERKRTLLGPYRRFMPRA